MQNKHETNTNNCLYKDIPNPKDTLTNKTKGGIYSS
jgi:hypothetical protein